MSTNITGASNRDAKSKREIQKTLCAQLLMVLGLLAFIHLVSKPC